MTRRSVILLLPASVGALAQNRQERGRQLMDDAIAALGGDRFLAMSTRVEFGRAYSFYREELSGLSVATIYTRYLPDAEPGVAGLEERQSFGKEERFGAALFAGGKGWEITFRGARPISDERYERWRDSTLRNVFYILKQRRKEQGLVFEAVGTDIIDNQPVETVNVVDADNFTVTVHLHRTSKLPVRQVYFRRDPKTRVRTEEVTIFSKYRDLGNGVQWPLDVQRLRDGERNYQMYAESVQINQPLGDDLFQLAPGVKLLKPAK